MILLFLGIGCYAFAQTSIGAINVNPDAALTIDELKGQPGVHIDIQEVYVNGLAGKEIWFQCWIGSTGEGAEWYDSLTAYFTAMAVKDYERTYWESMYFEFTKKRLEEELGPGTHNLAVKFGIYDKNNLSQVIPDGWGVQYFTIQLGEEEE